MPEPSVDAVGHPRVLFDAGVAVDAHRATKRLPRLVRAAQPTMASIPSVLRTADETDQSIKGPTKVRLLIQSYEPTRRSTNGKGKPYVRAHVRGTEGFQKTRGASRDADGTARWFETQELELDISTGRIVKLQFVDEAGRSTRV